jgi:hypothetical protein
VKKRLKIRMVVTARGVIPAPKFIGKTSSKNPRKHWIPPYQVRGRLNQARNDGQEETSVVVDNRYSGAFFSSPLKGLGADREAAVYDQVLARDE